MNQFVKEQLEKCQNVEFIYNDDSTEIFIPKVSPLSLFVGECYAICVNLQNLNSPDGELFTINWNSGKKIVDEYINICVTDIVGDAVKFDGSTDDNNMYVDMWIKKKNFKVISKL